MPRKTELDYLAEIAAKAGTAEITGSVNVGTVDLGATSLAALEEVKVTNASDDSIINTSALGSIVSTGAAVQTASFDAGANADYVVISIQGSGMSGALYYDLSTNNSTWDAGNVASGFQTYYDIPAASTTDAYSYKSVSATSFFGGTRSGYNGRLIVPLQQFQPSSGTITTYRYIRLNAPAAIAAWRYRFTSFKSVNPLLPSSVLGNHSTTRVAGRVDVGVVSTLPSLPAGTNTIGSVNITNSDSIPENSTLQLTVIQPNFGGSYVKQGSSFYQGPGDDKLFWQSGNSRWEFQGDNNFLHTYNNSANQSAAYIPKLGWAIGDNPSFRGVEISARKDIDLVNNVTGLGSGVEAAASGDTTGTSVVAILKRGLVHLSSIISKLPALVSNRIPVDVSNLPALSAGTNTIGSVNVLGGNATALTVTDRGTTGPAIVTNFNFTASTAIAASNSARKLLTIFNEGAGLLYVLYGNGTASATNYSVRINSGDYLEIDKYTGAVTGIFGSAGTARITEIT
jgi:hypothetical protein